MYKLCFLFLLPLMVFASESYYYKNGVKTVLTPVQNSLRTNEKVKYYKDERGIELGVKDTILLKLNDQQKLSDLQNRFGFVVIKRYKNSLYLLQVKDPQNTLDIANALNQEDGVAYTQPDFVKKVVKR